MHLKPKRFLPGLVLLAAATALAVPPSWWTDGEPPVIDITAAPNNHGPANIGQAKHMAQSALAALRQAAPAIADQVEADIVGPGKPIPNWDPPANEAERDKNHSPLLVGQLKATAAPFYSRLNAVAPEWLESERIANGTNHSNSIFPWTTVITDDQNKAVATIGQVKSVFSLRFDFLLDDEDVDSDGDGLSDAWEIANGFDPLGSSGEAYADGDQDGMTNATEHTRKLNPMRRDNPALLLQVTVE
jgi:hypothetical protein